MTTYFSVPITSIVSELDLRTFVISGGPQTGLSMTKVWTFRVVPGPVALSGIAGKEGSASFSAGHDDGAIVVALAVGLATVLNWVKTTYY